MIEERADVGIPYQVHLPAADRDPASVHRIVCSACGPEPGREPQEALFRDRAQHRGDGALDDFVFQSGDRQRPLRPIRFRDHDPPGGVRPVCAFVDAFVQLHEPVLETCLVILPCQPVDAGGGLALERLDRVPEPFGVDMVQKRSEPFLLPCLCGLPYAVLYRARLVRHRIESYAASAAGESWFCRTAAGVWNPCRSMSQVVL
jgi:hypothetical protein